MEIRKETLDDVLRELYPPLIGSNERIMTSRGYTRELLGVLFKITRPRARLSRTETRGKAFSCLGELLWYLSGSNNLEFIKYYIPDYVKESEDKFAIYGAYGPRLFCLRENDQIANVIALLRKNPNTRRAVIQIFDSDDIASERKEIPCTTTFHFMVRDNRVHMLTTMRSNDAYLGLPHDVFCFSMLQEIIACSLGIELGTYRHFVGSMHLYDRDLSKAEEFVSEGLQSRIEMPRMPDGDPWPSIKKVLGAEMLVRSKEAIDANAVGVEPYWADLIRLLQIFAGVRIDGLKAAMTSKIYNAYIRPRRGMKRGSK
jgi:thymidylate synthase